VNLKRLEQRVGLAEGRMPQYETDIDLSQLERHERMELTAYMERCSRYFHLNACRPYPVSLVLSPDECVRYEGLMSRAPMTERVIVKSRGVTA
jgi:hypothetical protein